MGAIDFQHDVGVRLTMLFDVPHNRGELPLMPLWNVSLQRGRWAFADGKEYATKMTFQYGRDADKWPNGRIAANACGYFDYPVGSRIEYRSFLRGYGRVHDF